MMLRYMFVAGLRIVQIGSFHLKQLDILKNIPSPTLPAEPAELFYVDLLQFLLRPDLDIYFRNKKQQQQNNQFISNQLSQTNIVLSKKIQGELLYSYYLHKLSGGKSLAHPLLWGSHFYGSSVPFQSKHPCIASLS